MRYVFLDVDGVLNSDHTPDDPQSFTKLDRRNIAVFRELMECLYHRYGRDSVRIVLSSSWRRGEGVFREDDPLRGKLDTALAREGLIIDAETPQIGDQSGRGLEIMTWLSVHHAELDGYLVLDDCLFGDFRHYRITRHFVQTTCCGRSGTGGLQPKHIPCALCAIDREIRPDETGLLKNLINAADHSPWERSAAYSIKCCGSL